MKKHLARNLLLLLTFIPCIEVFAGWNDFIINFDKNKYGKGAQTWKIVPYDDKWVFFANKNGMLQFDGNIWDIFPVNNASDVRSVLVSTSHNRIYAGGINEFGYFEPGKDGSLKYYCMSDTLEDECRLLGNVWNIHETDHIIYFQGDSKIIKYINGKYTAIELGAKIDCSSMIRDVLYIGSDCGIWVLVGNTFFPLQGAEELTSKRIRGIIPYNNGVLVATAYSGLFFCDGRTMKPFITGAEDFMRENEVFCVATKGNQIALGTIHKGIILINSKSKKLNYFNENNGLHNNTVLSVSFDASDNLWAGLDSGLDYVCITSPFTNLYSYPHSYGAGYTAAIKDSFLYLGTNRGLYYTSYPVRLDGNMPDIHPVPQSSGQVWNLSQIGDELYCMHDRGIFCVQRDGLKRVTDITGAWCCQPVIGHKDLLYVGVYNGMYLVSVKDHEWKIIGKIEGLNDSSRLFEQEDARTLWMNNADHITRVKLSENLTKVISTKIYDSKNGLPFNNNIYPSKIKGLIYFATPSGIYKYNAHKDAMEPNAEMNNLLNGAAPYSRLLEHKDHLVSLSPYEICIANLGSYKKGANTIINPIRRPKIESVLNFESIIPLCDSLWVIPNEDGFALFSIPSERKQQDRIYSLYIKNMYLSYPKDSLIYTANYLKQKPALRIAYTLNSIRFEYGLSSLLLSDDMHFRYRLNDEEWSDFSIARTKEYSNLHEGDYTFEVKALFPDGTSSADSISFRILPPWYRSLIAYVCYIIFALAIMWTIYRWDNIRVNRKKRQAIVEKEKEMQAMEIEYEEVKAKNEKQIIELEKEKLEYDLKHKSQEMANLMINIVRKNEMLTEIKSEITKVSAILKGESSREGKLQLMLINSKIDSNIQSDEVLKRIEDQFDLIHNNFMKRLHAKHPDLSNNERMMCAYLKMHLSTKEIAPLLNISVRGVETIRYRLRKKFALEREDSLTDYLSNYL